MPPTRAPETAPRGQRTPPFQGAVALGLSGGGFRAAGFHLGVVTVLQRVGLLGEVRALSTVSGGTLVGARLMIGLAHGERFDEIHHALRRFLESADPVPAALARATAARTTLTRALAQELDETLFASSRWQSPTLRELYDARIPMAEGSFNACELRSGRPFRFAFSRGAHARVGHRGAHLPRKVAENVRLADVAAASCAFPGAFEPMVVPDDLVWPDDEVRAEAAAALGQGSIGLVDGGVHDNQGIDPLLLASERVEESLGLVLVSDADRGLDAPEPRDPARRRRWGGPRLWQLDAAALLFGLMGLTSMGLLVAKAQAERDIHDFRWASDGVAFGVPGAFCGLALLGLLLVRRTVVRAVAPLLPDLGPGGRRSLRRARLGDVLDALQVRVRTLRAVAGTAFPRRLRGLVYRSAWSNGRLVDRRVAVQLGSLGADRVAMIDGLTTPTEGLVAACRRSAGLGVALRIGSPEELEDLMRAGQATAVMALVEAFESQLGPVRESWPRSVRELDDRLRADWDTLNTSDRALRPARD